MARHRTIPLYRSQRGDSGFGQNAYPLNSSREACTHFASVHTLCLFDILTTTIPFKRGMLSSYIPRLIDVDDEELDTELGQLQGHAALQNP